MEFYIREAPFDIQDNSITEYRTVWGRAWYRDKKLDRRSRVFFDFYDLRNAKGRIFIEKNIKILACRNRFPAVLEADYDP